MNRSDDALILAGVPEGVARRANAAGNACVRNRLSVPDDPCDLVLADHPVAIADQVDDEGEHLRFRPNRLSVPVKLEPCRVQGEFTEPPCHETDYRKIVGFYRNSSEALQAISRQEAIIP
ncbi:hypothetical protein [Pararhodobacter sp. SW119]|uniref:hypothetical protein n=1 Tax=Pararhodobacter sp. SW119 TaxID=2780075 RepID=UPI001FD7BBED|nr:hypothetical protein [Pararhodobacter sp. SW119]